MNEANKTTDIGCLEAIESLYAWLDNELEDAELTAGLESHLSHCKSCWSRAEMEKALTEHIKRSAGSRKEEGTSPSAPATLQTRLEKLMKKL
jgi:anti-sigma factor (TIGR02949 family)